MKFTLGKGIDDGNETHSLSHRQLLIIIFAVAAILLISAGVYGSTRLSRSNREDSEFTGNIEVKRDACKLFDLEDAKNVLGKNSEASPNNANAVSSKATVSTCSYSSGSKNLDELIALTILVRSSNKIQARQVFETARDSQAEQIKNLGDQAYYNQSASQLNVLKNEHWIIIASTKGKAGKGTVAIPKQVAQVILDRL